MYLKIATPIYFYIIIKVINEILKNYTLFINY